MPLSNCERPDLGVLNEPSNGKLCCSEVRSYGRMPTKVSQTLSPRSNSARHVSLTAAVIREAAYFPHRRIGENNSVRSRSRGFSRPAPRHSICRLGSVMFSHNGVGPEPLGAGRHKLLERTTLPNIRIYHRKRVAGMRSVRRGIAYLNDVAINKLCSLLI